MLRQAKYWGAAVIFVTVFTHVRAEGDFSSRAADFLTEDVCIDASGNVQHGVSPLDYATCKMRRQLKVGEAPTYYREDWPNNRDAAKSARGTQRSNSFPIAIGGRIMYASDFDFGDSTYKFGQFKRGDGGQLVALDGDRASVILTEDHGGLKFFFGPNCGRSVTVGSLMNSWILFDNSVFVEQKGATVAHVRQTLNADACPTKLDESITRWKLAQIRFRSDIEHHLTEPLSTIVTDHFSQKNEQTAGAMERMYFTRELGWTRWEAWKNLAARGADTEKLRAKSTALAASGRCDLRDGPPSNNGDWVMVDCREWTNIGPAAPDAAKPAGFWIDNLLARPTMERLVR
ncbi:hypothetical protein ACRS8P_21085 [Burkholderia cenocepacia]